MLDIVFRSCDNTDVHPERGPRFICVEKSILIKKCFLSLTNSIKLANSDVRLWVVDDNSKQELLQYFKDVCKIQNIPLKITSLQQSGYNYSALKQFELCKNVGRKWVYSVEDDYLHFPEAISTLIEEAEQFTAFFGREVAIRPDDDVFTYSSNSPHSKNPCMLFLGNNRHWRTCFGSHNTIFTHVKIFKEYWELFASLAKFFRKTTVNEDGTINTIWTNCVSKDGPVPLISPLPTLAIHISQNNEPKFLDYKSLWNSLKIDEYS